MRESEKSLGHGFLIDDAIKYGIEPAIILSRLRHWIRENRANGTGYFKGRTWTYCSTSALVKIYPYMSKDIIYNSLQKLRKAEVILSGNFNSNPHDRTLWYTINDKEDSTQNPAPISPNDEIETVNQRNARKIIDPLIVAEGTIVPSTDLPDGNSGRVLRKNLHPKDEKRVARKKDTKSLSAVTHARLTMLSTVGGFKHKPLPPAGTQVGDNGTGWILKAAKYIAWIKAGKLYERLDHRWAAKFGIQEMQAMADEELEAVLKKSAARFARSKLPEYRIGDSDTKEGKDIASFLFNSFSSKSPFMKWYFNEPKHNQRYRADKYKKELPADVLGKAEVYFEAQAQDRSKIERPRAEFFKSLTALFEWYDEEKDWLYRYDRVYGQNNWMSYMPTPMGFWNRLYDCMNEKGGLFAFTDGGRLFYPRDRSRGWYLFKKWMADTHGIDVDPDSKYKKEIDRKEKADAADGLRDKIIAEAKSRVARQIQIAEEEGLDPISPAEEDQMYDRIKAKVEKEFNAKGASHG